LGRTIQATKINKPTATQGYFRNGKRTDVLGAEVVTVKTIPDTLQDPLGIAQVAATFGVEEKFAAVI
jgi:hypothetical protein